MTGDFAPLDAGTKGKCSAQSPKRFTNVGTIECKATAQHYLYRNELTDLTNLMAERTERCLLDVFSTDKGKNQAAQRCKRLRDVWRGLWGSQWRGVWSRCDEEIRSAQFNCDYLGSVARTHQRLTWYGHSLDQ